METGGFPQDTGAALALGPVTAEAHVRPAPATPFRATTTAPSGMPTKLADAVLIGPESTVIKYTIAPNGYGPPHEGGVEAVQPNDGPGLALGPTSRPGPGTFPAQTPPGHPNYPEQHPRPSSGNLGRFPGT